MNGPLGRDTSIPGPENYCVQTWEVQIADMCSSSSGSWAGMGLVAPEVDREKGRKAIMGKVIG